MTSNKNAIMEKISLQKMGVFQIKMSAQNKNEL